MLFADMSSQAAVHANSLYHEWGLVTVVIGLGIAPARALQDIQRSAAVGGPPGAVFHPLVTLGDECGPWLMDGEAFHRPASVRGKKETATSQPIGWKSFSSVSIDGETWPDTIRPMLLESTPVSFSAR